jgi:uncharacterized protein (DUF342 family)
MTPELRKRYAERQITVYPKSLDMLQAWKDRAEKAGLSLNALIIEIMTQAIEGTSAIGNGVSHQPAVDEELVASINELKEENQALRTELKNARLDIAKMMITQAATTPSADLLEIKKMLLEQLGEGGTWKPADLNAVLSEKHQSIIHNIRSISSALQELNDLGLVGETPKGYKLMFKRC